MEPGQAQGTVSHGHIWLQVELMEKCGRKVRYPDVDDIGQIIVCLEYRYIRIIVTVLTFQTKNYIKSSYCILNESDSKDIEYLWKYP